MSSWRARASPARGAHRVWIAVLVPAIRAGHLTTLRATGIPLAGRALMLPSLRRSFHDYAPAAEAPLAGYGAALLVYGVALSLALRVARRRRAQPHWTDVALLGVATHKLARLISKDFVTAPIRAPFTRRQEAEGAAEVHDEPRGGTLRKAVGHLLTCPYCLGVWIATSLNTLLLLRPVQSRFVLRILASDTISDFLHLSYSRLNESRKAISAATDERAAVATHASS